MSQPTANRELRNEEFNQTTSLSKLNFYNKYSQNANKNVDTLSNPGNESTNPDNWCFNANLPYGVHNSTGCKGGDTTLK